MAFGYEAERVLGLPVAVENDINLAALGEHWLGVARGVDDFIFLSVGTGLGAGLVLHGELHRGPTRRGGRARFRLGRPRARHRPVRGALSELSSKLAERDGETLLVPPTILLPCSQRRARVTRSRVRS